MNAQLMSSHYEEDVKGYYYLAENCSKAMSKYPDTYDPLTSLKKMTICREKDFRNKEKIIQRVA